MVLMRIMAIKQGVIMSLKKSNVIVLLLLFLCMLGGCGEDSESVRDIIDVLAEHGSEEVTTEEATKTTEEATEEITEEITEEPTEAATEETTTEEVVEGPVELTELTAQIQSIIQSERDKGAMVSVEVKDLNTGDYVSLSQGQQQSASLIKLYVAGCVYENMEQVRLTQTYEGEIEELIKAMITVSDNDATNTLVTKLGQGDANVGMANVNQYCQNHGFTETFMGRLMLDFESTSDNYTSVTDCTKFLTAIYNNALTGSESILGYMKQQERTGKIPAGVPAGVETANKTGELTDVENDVAFVFTDHGTYIICVMMSGLQDTSVARDMIIHISSQVYDYMD